MGVVYEFRNVSTGQTITPTWGNPSGIEVQLPPGTYDLTVKRPNNLHSRSQWVNIVVPVAVSTNGQGTGCRFLGPGENTCGCDAVETLTTSKAVFLSPQ
jgi:hypothetical protein